jgi:hypothetical protein
MSSTGPIVRTLIHALFETGPDFGRAIFLSRSGRGHEEVDTRSARGDCGGGGLRPVGRRPNGAFTQVCRLVCHALRAPAFRFRVRAAFGPASFIRPE